MDIGRVGVWTRTDGFSTGEAIEFAQRVEELGYGALWIPDAFGRDPFAHAALLFSHTSRLVIGTGVVNIHLREAQATACAQKELHDQSDGRFLLGLGVSHATAMESLFRKPYPKPLASMRAYLDAIEKAMWWGPELDGEPPIVLAALGPLMLKLAGERTLGAHPFFAPPENTQRSREIMGPGPWLCPEQKVLLETDPAKARERARTAMSGPLTMPNYRRNLMRSGFEESELDDGGNDRVVDAVVAWGDVEALVERVQDHLDAGATHVCIQPLDVANPTRPSLKTLEALAPSLLEG
ncbi:MAG: TIGR03620 family F420-dependent LLM class oxidoreductase [Myxococcales bacterium]|nr:TIGR03620 family F420-dependent LLM class oxidoreductase [Myxococcales bacterium]